MVSRIDQETNFSQTALNLRAFRQELLASNIANADTPNYKARDIDFKTALAGALGASTGPGSDPLALTQTAAGHLSAPGANSFGAKLLYRSEYQSSVDGNTVNMDIERAAFAENAVQTEAVLTFIREKFKELSAAVSP